MIHIHIKPHIYIYIYSVYIYTIYNINIYIYIHIHIYIHGIHCYIYMLMCFVSWQSLRCSISTWQFFSRPRPAVRVTLSHDMTKTSKRSIRQTVLEIANGFLSTFFLGMEAADFSISPFFTKLGVADV